MSQSPQNLLPGEWVRVRSRRDLRHARRQRRPRRSAVPARDVEVRGRKFRLPSGHKTCDTVSGPACGSWSTVHWRCFAATAARWRLPGRLLAVLEGSLARALRRPEALGLPRNDRLPGPVAKPMTLQGILPANRQAAVLHEAELEAAQCQIIEGSRSTVAATRLRKFTAPLPFWHLGSTWTTCETASPRGGCCATRRSRPGTGFSAPRSAHLSNVRGQLKRTPDESLDLQPGEWVE